MRPWVYGMLYRLRIAPWDQGVRGELVDAVKSGRLEPVEAPSAVDLGCGTGACAVFLAERGFDVVGVDFSRVAIRRAERAAAEAGVGDRCRFVHADITAASIPGVEGPFDLLLDFGTLDDLTGAARQAMVATIHRLSRPGSRFMLWCFYADADELPRARFAGASRMKGQAFAPGEEQRLFGAAFDIERLPEPPPPDHAACFLMTRR